MPDDDDVRTEETLPACPACGADNLRIEWRITAKEIGTFSLAGTQPKFSATEVPWLVCDSCKVEARGHHD